MPEEKTTKSCANPHGCWLWPVDNCLPYSDNHRVYSGGFPGQSDIHRVLSTESTAAPYSDKYRCRGASFYSDIVANVDVIVLFPDCP